MSWDCVLVAIPRHIKLYTAIFHGVTGSNDPLPRAIRKSTLAGCFWLANIIAFNQVAAEPRCIEEPHAERQRESVGTAHGKGEEELRRCDRKSLFFPPHHHHSAFIFATKNTPSCQQPPSSSNIRSSIASRYSDPRRLSVVGMSDHSKNMNMKSLPRSKPCANAQRPATAHHSQKSPPTATPHPESLSSTHPENPP